MTELDFHHLNTVLDRLVERAGITGLTVGQAFDGVWMTASSSVSVRHLRTGLTRAGYEVQRLRRFGPRNELTISGWSSAALAKRVSALRAEVDRLAGTRRDTASVAVAHAADPADARTRAERGLRHRAEAHAGIIVPSAPRTEPTDPEARRLLSTVRLLERQVIERIEHHASTAELAVDLYARYRRHTTDGLARSAAVHDAYLSGRRQTTTGVERRSGVVRPALSPAREQPQADGSEIVAAAARDFPARATAAAAVRPSRVEPQPPGAGGPGTTSRRSR